MDQKKTLWIIAAVGAFLLFVLGAAFIMYPKAPKVEQTITTNSLVESKNLSKISEKEQEDDGFVKDNVEVPNDLTVKDLTVFAENTNVYGFGTNSSTNEDGETVDLNTLKSQIENQTEKSNQITVVIKDENSKNIVAENNLPSNSEIDYYVEKTPEKSVKSTKDETSVKSKNITKKNEFVSNTKKTTSTKVNSKTVEKVATTKTQFWVQVGSYSNKKTAEIARSSLEENKIPSDIFTYEDSKGKLFYRVRVGPYTTKSEAEYWRSKIIKIDEFSKAESYITSTQTEL